jgi:hypothetical protein
MTRTKPILRGYRGARLGEPYEYRWVDQQPTSQTWADLADKRGCWGAFLGILIVLAIGIIGGARDFGWVIFAYLAFSIVVFGMQHYFRDKGRTDNEPVPRAVRREAWIEFYEGEFFFTLAVDGKPEIWQPWPLVRRFEKVDYWSMFGDAGKSPYQTGWHAIAMTPATGKPWLIGSTIEGEAEVREKFTALDQRFSDEACARFMRAYEVQKKRQSHARTNGPDPGSDGSGVPLSL